MTIACKISFNLCFRLLSCVALLTSSELSQSKAMTVSMIPRSEKALVPTADLLSTPVEETTAFLTAEKKMGLLSRLLSFFKPSNIWNRLASSWIMRLFKPHIYLRYAPDKEAAAFQLLKKAHVDKVEKNLFNSREFQTWARYFEKAFPENPMIGFELMMSTLAKHETSKFLDSIPTTKAVDGDLVLSDHFAIALIDFLAKVEETKDSKAFVESLEDSLLKLSANLKAVESSKATGELIEGEILHRWLNSGGRKLIDIYNLPKLQKWYFSQPQQEQSDLTKALHLELQEQGFGWTAFGDAYIAAEDGAAKTIATDIVKFILEQNLVQLNLEKMNDGLDRLSFDLWVNTAIDLQADPVKIALPLLRKVASDEVILKYCASETSEQNFRAKSLMRSSSHRQ
ncbi:hypothetical protein Plhal304r1_c003g0012831 [Plasmopara halstedii]